MKSIFKTLIYCGNGDYNETVGISFKYTCSMLAIFGVKCERKETKMWEVLKSRHSYGVVSYQFVMKDEGSFYNNVETKNYAIKANQEIKPGAIYYALNEKGEKLRFAREYGSGEVEAQLFVELFGENETILQFRVKASATLPSIGFRYIGISLDKNYVPTLHMMSDAEGDIETAEESGIKLQLTDFQKNLLKNIP